MFKMISAEVYKLKRSESFWIMLLAIGVLSVIFSVAFGFIPGEELMGMRPETAGEMFMSGFGNITQNILFLLIGFTVVFVNSDFTLGTIRNPLAVGVTRLNYLIAKFITILITCFLFMVVAILATGLPYLIFEPWGDVFNLSNFLATFALGYLILVAQATLFMAIAFITRKVGTTLGIIIGYILFDATVAAFIMMTDIDGIVRTVANILPSAAGFYLAELSMGTAIFGNIMMIVGIAVATIVIASGLAIKSLTSKDV